MSQRTFLHDATQQTQSVSYLVQVGQDPGYSPVPVGEMKVATKLYLCMWKQYKLL